MRGPSLRVFSSTISGAGSSSYVSSSAFARCEKLRGLVSDNNPEDVKQAVRAEGLAEYDNRVVVLHDLEVCVPVPVSVRRVHVELDGRLGPARRLPFAVDEGRDAGCVLGRCCDPSPRRLWKLSKASSISRAPLTNVARLSRRMCNPRLMVSSRSIRAGST